VATLNNAPLHASFSQADTAPIRLVLVDHHLLLRESLARLLAGSGFQLAGECSSTAEGLACLKGAEVDVVLVDLGIAQDFIPAARAAGYQGKFLVVAGEIDVNGSAAVLKSGASGIFLESDSSARLVQAIRVVASGDPWVDRKLIQLLAEHYPRIEGEKFGTVTPLERSVVNGILQGLTNREIGAQMGASESTVKATLQQLFRKAGVRTRSQLVRIALEGWRER